MRAVSVAVAWSIGVAPATRVTQCGAHIPCESKVMLLTDRVSLESTWRQHRVNMMSTQIHNGICSHPPRLY
jgi:hypothetical protein